MKRKIFLLLMSFCVADILFAQDAADTSLLINEFTRVMSFTAQPYLHYITTTKMNAVPVLESRDTSEIKGEFFKNFTDIYSNNGRDELYLQDSFMIEVNNDRKTIWIRKVNVATKEKMNIMPVNSKEMLSMLRNNYSVTRTQLNEEMFKLDFETRKQQTTAPSTHTLISMEYSIKTWLPQKINITINLKQIMDEEALAVLQQEGVAEDKLVQIIDGVKYLVRKQTMSIYFIVVDNEKESFKSMPVYTSVVEYNSSTQDYIGKGIYKDYEITKTF